MFKEMFWLCLLGLIFAAKIIFPILIEIIKKLIKFPEDEKEKSILCFKIALIMGIILYLIFLLFYPEKVEVNFLNIIKLFAVGVIFSLLTGGGALSGYDTIIKMVKDIWQIFFPIPKK